ncbi:MAG TPA: hypothetical protein PKI93_04410 [Alphaproteobacteria bacterium]|nr:hypothetical protein [Alphaproteobacteria bacterium]HNS45192.1 hypothetical protein [Alphaproteobacteria bacterium]
MTLDKQKAIAEYATEVFNNQDYDLQKLEIRRAVYAASGMFWWSVDQEVGQNFILEYASVASGDNLDTILRVKDKLNSLRDTSHHRRQLEHYLLSL